jgi:ABC-type bacteriocin/lantibiotic exporter with double-glycine peptidase domain
MQTFKKLLNLLTVREHKSTAFLLGMILIMALIDMIGVASILPFMAVLTNPNIIETNNFLNSMFEASKIFGIENKQEFLFALGLLVFILLITSLFVRAFTTYVQLKFVQMLEYSMTKRLIEGYLHQPYSWFLSRHSADIGKNILSEVAGVMGGGITPIIEIIAKSMVAIALITLLFLANPKLTLIIGLLLGGTYMLIFYFIRSYLRKIGEKRLANNELRFKSVIEAFGAAKEVKVGGLEQTYVERFSEPSYIFAKTQASSGVIGQLPRYILEAIAFGGVLLIILYMMAQSGNFGTALPILSLYVFAGYRLMPALQQIYSSFTQLAFIGPSIEKLHEDIKSVNPFNSNEDQSALYFII